MTEIIPLYPESYDAKKAAWENMEISDVFAEWMLIKDPELKEALKVYARNRMGSQAGYCLK